MADTRRLSEPGSRIVLDPATREAVRAAHAVVDRAVSESRRVYGINTGMGSLADSAIDVDLLSELQRRLILSNAAGTGEPLPDRVVRRTMLLKINTLGLANSGVSETHGRRADCNLFNRDAHPCIPSKGSVGASGDLAPLAHLGAAMMGEGEMRLVRRDGSRRRRAGAPGAWNRSCRRPRKGSRWSTAPRSRSRSPWKACSPSRTSSPRRWWPVR